VTVTIWNLDQVFAKTATTTYPGCRAPAGIAANLVLWVLLVQHPICVEDARKNALLSPCA